MTNRIALWIGGLVILLFIADALWLGWELPTVLGRQFLRFLEWISFWR